MTTNPNTPAPLSPEREAELGRQMTQALSKAGAFCGECGFEPGDEGCADCKRHYRWCVDELMPIVRAELDRTRAEREALQSDFDKAIEGFNASALEIAELKKRVTELEGAASLDVRVCPWCDAEQENCNLCGVDMDATKGPTRGDR